MTTPPAAVEFIIHYPALGIPFSLLVYLAVFWSGARISRELLYVSAAAPGLLILWAWTHYLPGLPGGWAGVGDFLLSSAFLIPTNLLSPALIIAMSISALSAKLRHRPVSEFKKIDTVLLGLIALAYGYDQMIITGGPDSTVRMS
jgi:hypothetical protein